VVPNSTQTTCTSLLLLEPLSREFNNLISWNIP